MSSKRLRVSPKSITHETDSAGEGLNDTLNVFYGNSLFPDDTLSGQSPLRVSTPQSTGETREARCLRLLAGIRKRGRR
jgi:hypothetical protein